MTAKPPFFTGANWVWMNGEMKTWDQSTTHISDHGLHYGTGVFEGIRSYATPEGPRVFRLDAHLDRLVDSAAAYNMKLPFSREQFTAAIGKVMDANGLQGNSYIRLFCWFGCSDLTLGSFRWPVQAAIIAAPFGRLFGDELSGQGLRVAISPWRKIHHSMLPTTAKSCGQYLGSVLASRYASQNGCHEALLLAADGTLSEGPAENIFLVNDGELLTNDERSSILLGITRDSVIDIARDLSIPVSVRPITLEDLDSASEAFFTGTAVEVVRIRSVDTKAFEPSSPASITDRIQAAFNRIVGGLEPRYHRWLQDVSTPVFGSAQGSYENAARR